MASMSLRREGMLLIGGVDAEGCVEDGSCGWRSGGSLEMVSSLVLVLCTHMQFYASGIRHDTVIPKRTRIYEVSTEANTAFRKEERSCDGALVVGSQRSHPCIFTDTTVRVRPMRRSNPSRCHHSAHEMEGLRLRG